MDSGEQKGVDSADRGYYDAVVTPLDSSSIDRSAGDARALPGRAWQARLPFFYGWVIVGGTCFALGITYSIWYSFSVFYVALLEEFGWGRAPTAAAFSIFVIAIGVSGAGVGWLSDRFGPGRVTALGTVVLAGGLMGCSQIRELWQFYLFYGVVCAAGVASSGWVTCVSMVTRWFSVRLGTALGVASAGIGVGMVVIVPMAQVLINHLGWRATYQILAATVLVGVAPISLLVIRGKPEDFGLSRDGSRISSHPRGSHEEARGKRQFRVVNREWVSRPWTIAMAARTHRYWSVMAMLALNNIATQMIFVHQVAFLVDGGYDKLLAASVVGLVGLVSMGTKILWGSVSDRLGREITWTMGLTCLAMSMVLLIATRLVAFPPLVYVFAIAFALGYGVCPPLAPAVMADLFSGRRFASIFGTSQIANGMGSATGAWLAGYVFDATGSYLLALACGATTSLLSLGAVWVASPGKVRAVAGREPRDGIQRG